MQQISQIPPGIYFVEKVPLRMPFPVNLPGGSFRGKDVFAHPMMELAYGS